jgi:hypothetical protein
MKSITFTYAGDDQDAHIVIARDGLAITHGEPHSDVTVRLRRDGYGPTLRQFRTAEGFARQARAARARIVFENDTYPW